MNPNTRFHIQVSPWVKPLLVLFTATGARLWVELTEDGISVRFGWYTTTVPYALVKSGRRSRWPWYSGLGWRTNFRSVLGLIGAYDGIVEINLEPPHRTSLLGIGFDMQQLYVSLEEPEQFLRALESRVLDLRGNSTSE